MGYRGGKDTTEQYHGIDIRTLHRKGFLKPGGGFTLRWSRIGVTTGVLVGSAERHWLALSYMSCQFGSQEGECQRLRVALTWTRCHFGGRRPWFICPIVRCGRRAAVLYGGRLFACCHCYHLVYESQRETDNDRAQTIRMRLGGSGSMAEPFPPRPKGMHWQTYDRLCTLYERAEEESCRGIAVWLGRLRP